MSQSKSSNSHQGLLKSTFCQVPFREFHIYSDGQVANCCLSWLPYKLGSILDLNLLDFLKTELSQKIQKSVLDGDYRYCSKQDCPALNCLIHNEKLTHPLVENSHRDFKLSEKTIRLTLSYDKSCNLFCESCRNNKIFYTERTAPSQLLAIHDRVRSQIFDLIAQGYTLDLTVTGSGDALASPLYYELLKQLPDTDQVRLTLLTNGIMLTPMKISPLLNKTIQYVSVSVDAATEETYHKVRRGGSFSMLQKNLKDFDTMVQNKAFKNFHGWELNFIVQQDNYQEMGQFVDWARQFRSLNTVAFMMIQDWGHLTPEQFSKKAVWKNENPEHMNFIKCVQDERLNSPQVNIGNLAQFRQTSRGPLANFSDLVRKLQKSFSSQEKFE